MKGRIGEINFNKALDYLKSGDVESCIKHSQRATEFGHERGETLLVMAEYLKRLQTLMKLVEEGHVDAMYELGMLYVCGVGMEGKKLEEGLELMEKAWDVGRHEKAGQVISACDDDEDDDDGGGGGEEKTPKLLIALHVLAEQGAPEAQLELAHALIMGEEGIVEKGSDERQVAEGLRFLRLAVAQNYKPALLALNDLRASLPAAPDHDDSTPEKSPE